MDKTLSNLLEQMTLEEKIGQMMYLGVLETPEGYPSQEMSELIQSIQPGGVRIYSSKGCPAFRISYTNQLQEWAAETKQSIPLIIGADCEYGVSEIVEHGINSYPLLMGRSATQSSKLAEEVSHALAQEAVSIGLNMLHQPVADVNTNPSNPVIGVRSAGKTVEEVQKYAKACLTGTKNAGIITVGKHYPGHGDTAWDSHLQLPTVTYDQETLYSIHMKPFEELINADLDGIMSAHIIVNCIDPDNPATLSNKILTEILRKKQGFNGFIVSDAMIMKAIADNYSPSEATTKAVQAGIDLVLCNGDTQFIKESFNGLVDAVKSGTISENQINQSVERILKVKKKHNWFNYQPSVQSALKIIDKNRALSLESYKKSYKLAGKKDLLPISKDTPIFVTGVNEVETFSHYLTNDFPHVINYPLSSACLENNWSPNDQEIDTALSIAEKAKVVLVLSANHNELASKQKELIKRLSKKIPTVVLALGLPYQYDDISEEMLVIATYLQTLRARPTPFPQTASEALIQLLKGN